jgi:hypothetical protein
VAATPAAEAQSDAAGRTHRRAAALHGILRVLRSAVVLGMFAGATVAGVLFYNGQRTTLPQGEYPSVATVPEPAAAHAIVELIVSNDAPALAKVLEADALEALSGALRTIDGSSQPLVEVTEVRYLGAVKMDEQTIVSYLARGRDPVGEKWVVGFALRVQGDMVVGVN